MIAFRQSTTFKLYAEIIFSLFFSPLIVLIPLRYHTYPIEILLTICMYYFIRPLIES